MRTSQQIEHLYPPHRRWEPGQYDGWKYLTPYQEAGNKNQIFATGLPRDKGEDLAFHACVSDISKVITTEFDPGKLDNCTVKTKDQDYDAKIASRCSHSVPGSDF
jgi:hypothetical protein